MKVRGVEWAEPETEVSTSKGRVLCARNIPISFPYSRLVDMFNQLSDGQVRIITYTITYIIVIKAYLLTVNISG